MGSDVYDWSLEGRLRQVREQLQQLEPKDGDIIPLMKQTVMDWKPSVAAEEDRPGAGGER